MCILPYRGLACIVRARAKSYYWFGKLNTALLQENTIHTITHSFSKEGIFARLFFITISRLWFITTHIDNNMNFDIVPCVLLVFSLHRFPLQDFSPETPRQIRFLRLLHLSLQYWHYQSIHTSSVVAYGNILLFQYPSHMTLRVLVWLECDW